MSAAGSSRHCAPPSNDATRNALYHSALEISVPAGRFTIEMAPIPDTHGQSRGVVAEGPVGMRWAGRFRVFRYEIRRWRDGVIPDAQHATSTVVVGVDVAGAERLLDLVPSVPTAVWGRDELDAGEMWNSNSVTSWLLARSRFDTSHLSPPSGGRAPGWQAGLIVAARAVADGTDSTTAGIARSDWWPAALGAARWRAWHKESQRTNVTGDAAPPQRFGPGYAIARLLATPLYRTLWRVHVEGGERLPQRGPAILAANHVSFFDSIVLIMTLRRTLSFVGKVEYLNSWKTRRVLPALGMIPVDRSDGRRAMAHEGVVAGGGVGVGEEVDVVHRQPASGDRLGQHRHAREAVGAT